MRAYLERRLILRTMSSFRKTDQNFYFATTMGMDLKTDFSEVKWVVVTK